MTTYVARDHEPISSRWRSRKNTRSIFVRSDSASAGIRGHRVGRSVVAVARCVPRRAGFLTGVPRGRPRVVAGDVEDRAQREATVDGEQRQGRPGPGRGRRSARPGRRCPPSAWNGRSWPDPCGGSRPRPPPWSPARGHFGHGQVAVVGGADDDAVAQRRCAAGTSVVRPSEVVARFGGSFTFAGADTLACSPFGPGRRPDF